MTDSRPAPAEGDALRRLIEQWRERAKTGIGVFGVTITTGGRLMYHACADELEAALAPLAAPGDASGEPELQIAERIARAAHAGQKDTVTGADYITHVERVVALVDGDEAKAVAWLHDVLEDCDEWIYDDLMREGISQRVCDAVDALTRQPPYSYAEYIEQIRVDKNPLVIAVKLADLRDHLQPNCPARLRPRYEKALESLTASVPSVNVASAHAVGLRDRVAPSGEDSGRSAAAVPSPPAHRRLPPIRKRRSEGARSTSVFGWTFPYRESNATRCRWAATTKERTMRPVKLYTADGGFVVAGMVPAFMEGKEADVLLWGERVFKLNRAGNGEAIDDHDGALLYTEAFAIWLAITDDKVTA